MIETDSAAAEKWQLLRTDASRVWKPVQVFERLEDACADIIRREGLSVHALSLRSWFHMTADGQGLVELGFESSNSFSYKITRFRRPSEDDAPQADMIEVGRRDGL